jgi:hypothetical protein
VFTVTCGIKTVYHDQRLLPNGPAITGSSKGSGEKEIKKAGAKERKKKSVRLDIE